MSRPECFIQYPKLNQAERGCLEAASGRLVPPLTRSPSKLSLDELALVSDDESVAASRDELGFDDAQSDGESSAVSSYALAPFERVPHLHQRRYRFL